MEWEIDKGEMKTRTPNHWDFYVPAGTSVGTQRPRQTTYEIQLNSLFGVYISDDQGLNQATLVKTRVNRCKMTKLANLYYN